MMRWPSIVRNNKTAHSCSIHTKQPLSHTLLDLAVAMKVILKGLWLMTYVTNVTWYRYMRHEWEHCYYLDQRTLMIPGMATYPACSHTLVRKGTCLQMVPVSAFKPSLWPLLMKESRTVISQIVQQLMRNDFPPVRLEASHQCCNLIWCRCNEADKVRVTIVTFRNQWKYHTKQIFIQICFLDFLHLHP